MLDIGFDDHTLVRAIQSDRNATNHLLRTVRPYVLRYCQIKLGRRRASYISADDVAQEVCIALLEALPTYRLQGTPFGAFVHAIAQRKVADAWRAHARDRSVPTNLLVESVDPTPGPEEHALNAEIAGRLGRLLTRLNPEQREILVLRVAVGLPARQVAEVVGKKAETVRMAQSRALARLRTLACSELEGQAGRP